MARRWRRISGHVIWRGHQHGGAWRLNNWRWRSSGRKSIGADGGALIAEQWRRRLAGDGIWRQRRWRRVAPGIKHRRHRASRCAASWRAPSGGRRRGSSGNKHLYRAYQLNAASYIASSPRLRASNMAMAAGEMASAWQLAYRTAMAWRNAAGGLANISSSYRNQYEAIAQCNIISGDNGCMWPSVHGRRNVSAYLRRNCVKICGVKAESV
jgi:hypothetical protein